MSAKGICPYCRGKNKVIIYQKDLWIELSTLLIGGIIGFAVGVLI